VDDDRRRAGALVGWNQVVLDDIAERVGVTLDGRDLRVRRRALEPGHERLGGRHRRRDRSLGTLLLLAALGEGVQQLAPAPCCSAVGTPTALR
jgi:hypothetical protein